MPFITEDVFITGQLDVDAVLQLSQEGFSTLVSHRPDNEEPGQPTADEVAAAARSAGLTFTHAPVTGLPDAEAVRVTRQVLDALPGGEKAVFFCRSGLRSAAAWAMAERLNGAEADDLRAAAAAAGYDLGRLPL